MKLGAKVPEDTLLREFDLSRAPDAVDNVGDNCETEEFRKCPLPASRPLEGLMIADFGRVCEGGAGEGEDLANGFARFGELFNWEGSISQGLVQ